MCDAGWNVLVLVQRYKTLERCHGAAERRERYLLQRLDGDGERVFLSSSLAIETVWNVDWSKIISEFSRINDFCCQLRDGIGQNVRPSFDVAIGMKGLNLGGVVEFCRVLTRQPQLLLPQLSVKGNFLCLLFECMQ